MDHHPGNKVVVISLFYILCVVFLSACGDSGKPENSEANIAYRTASSDRVVTIYFAGTTMTEHHWNKNIFLHPFSRPETIATLHRLQKGWQRKIDGTALPPDGKDCSGVDKDYVFCKHHKGMVDGIGRGLQFLDAANPTIFDSISRGWSDIFNEAMEILRPVSNQCQAQSCKITLNLVGFSRGAVSTMYFANRVLSTNDYLDIKKTITKTNILAFDPVPGDSFLHQQFFNLPPKLEYLGIYSSDERSAFFAPVFPARAVPPITSDPPVNFFVVPGSHETMVGNTRRSGHHWGLCTPLVFNCNDMLVDLDYVSSTLKIVATEIMGSSDWGHVRFRLPDTNNAVENGSYAQLDLDWYDNETDIGELKRKFDKKIEDIYGYTGYSYMHDYGFVLALEAWRAGCWTAFDTFVAPWNLLVSSDYPRCVYHSPGGYVRPWPYGIGLSDGPLDSNFAPLLSAKSGDDYKIWNMIMERGSLDVDDDLIDYSDDNCPDTFNPNQLDIDIDGIGDACDVLVSCDINVDGVVDVNDIRAIATKRNQPADGPDDPMDWDRNGVINVLDARGCVLACALPQCAPPPALEPGI